MHLVYSVRRVRFLIAVALWLATGFAVLGAPAAAAGSAGKGTPLPVPADPGFVGYPNSMASTGDSITRAYNTGSFPFTDAPENSWSTGSTPAVASHYYRILGVHPAINGHNNNDAVTGAQMVTLNTQVQSAVSQQVDYVTILMGANDVCTSSEANMTAVATLTSQFRAALDTVTSGLPTARIYVSSIPNIYNLWAILHTNSSAVATWNAFGICQSMLANPQSLAQPDVDRRNRVNQRVVDDNYELGKVCGLYVHCRFDNGAVFQTLFVPSEISTRDYFHPAVSGQTHLAAVSYAAGYDFTDATPPTTMARVILPILNGMMVELSAADNVGTAGIEYRINAGAYGRYTGRVTVPSGSTITYRAVDVNGNTEASHSLAAP